MIVRDVESGDWPAILALANRAVAHVPDAGTQEEWWENRRAFDATRRRRRQFVACEEGGEPVGYAAVEQSEDDPARFRVFLVPDAGRGESLGELLWQRARRAAAELGARRLFLVEYADDEPFRRFAEARGFRVDALFRLPDGARAVRYEAPADD